MSSNTSTGREGVDLGLPELMAMRGRATAKRQRTPARSRVGQNNKARPLGRGLDFAELRQYQAGDELRLIDWKTTARRGKVHSKLFQEERELPVLLLVDQRKALKFGTRVCFKSVQCARAAAAVAWRAVGQGDKVGALVFNDSQTHEFAPIGGHKGATKLCQMLVQSHAQDASGSLRLSDMLRELTRVAKTGGELWLVSDFYDWTNEDTTTLRGLCRHAAVRMVHVVDPLEWQLPAHPGCMVSDGLQWRSLPRAGSADAKRYAEQFELRAEGMRQDFNSVGARYQRVSTSDTLSPVFFSETLR